MSRSHNENTSDVEKEDEYGGLTKMLGGVQRTGQQERIIDNLVNDEDLECHYCRRPAEEVAPSDWSDPEAWGQKYETASDWVRHEDGTFNPTLWTFCCDSCYINLGQPSAPGRWLAGDPI